LGAWRVLGTSWLQVGSHHGQVPETLQKELRSQKRPTNEGLLAELGLMIGWQLMVLPLRTISQIYPMCGWSGPLKISFWPDSIGTDNP